MAVKRRVGCFASLMAVFLFPAACSDDSDLAAMLPATNEVGSWVLAGSPIVVTDSADLGKMNDANEPQYLGHGWERGVYGTYRQGSRTIEVAIHDMGSSENARAVWQDLLPATRTNCDNREYVVVDRGLPATYRTRSYWHEFYFELSIDEKSDVSLLSLQIFTLRVIDRNGG
jgi:hypothetical protein